MTEQGFSTRAIHAGQDPDPTTGSVQLTGGAGAVTLPAGGATTLEFRDYPVGSNSPTTLTATPLTRSSHHAGDDFARLKEARLAKVGA